MFYCTIDVEGEDWTAWQWIAVLQLFTENIVVLFRLCGYHGVLCCHYADSHLTQPCPPTPLAPQCSPMLPSATVIIIGGKSLEYFLAWATSKVERTYLHMGKHLTTQNSKKSEGYIIYGTCVNIVTKTSVVLFTGSMSFPVTSTDGRLRWSSLDSQV